MQTDLYINGEFIKTGRRQPVINPSTGEVIAEVSVGSAEDVRAAVAAARGAFDQGDWQRISRKERSGFLRAFSLGLLDRAGELANLETLNTGKPIKESTFMDIPSAAKTFEHAADNLERYLASETVNIEETAQSVLLREPYGVAALIVPWNYPLLIACWKLASALAAGNTVILKPSTLTPLTALELGNIARDAKFPPGVVNIISGPGDVVGRQLCADKRVDMISFTGSNETGRQIIAGSAGHAKKLIMELGGKSASIVCKDADLELAVNGSLCSIFLNQGQMCTAMSRIYVEEQVYDEFVADFTAKAKKIKLGPGVEFETQMGPLISQSQRSRVADFVGSACAEGAQLACGGKIPPDAVLSGGFFFEPTVFTGVTSAMRIFKEEVFGPVACVNRFSGMQEAVHSANTGDFGLAAAIWSRDIVRAREIAASIDAGIIWINTYGMFFNDLPYGGFKQSGFGKELGREGMLEYSRLKNLITDTTIGSKPLVNYWYGF